MRLLIEDFSPSEGNIITETVKANGNVFLQGIFMQAEIENRNKRKYPLSEIAKAVDTAQGMIKTYGGIFGELDHPNTLTINMDRISHVITELKMEGNNAIGKAKLLDTPMGMIAKKIAESGVRYGISSRGAGQVNESNGEVSGFHFITADLVATPSAPGAMPLPVYESLDLAKNGKVIVSLAESVKHDTAAQKYFNREVDKFLRDLLSK